MTYFTPSRRFLLAFFCLLIPVLRFLEISITFDPATGLTNHSIFNVLTPAAMALAAAAELYACRDIPKAKQRFSACFAAPSGDALLVTSGGMILAAGGILTLIRAFSAGGLANMAVSITAIAAGLGILYLVRNMRRNPDRVSVGPLLPALFFGIFLVLAVYIPSGSDPILERYWLRVLASCLVTCAFSLLAGFFKGETNPRMFSWVTSMAIISSTGVLIDLCSMDVKIMFLGAAMVLLSFISLLRPHGVKAPAAKSADSADSKE